MSADIDPAEALETKFHAFVESLSPDETKVLNELLSAWRDAGADDVEGFATDQGTYAQLFQMLSNMINAQNQQTASVVRNLRG